MVLRYRGAIKDQLPSDIKNRPKCWYGVNCKTMIHNEDHAKKLDHICEQVRKKLFQSLIVIVQILTLSISLLFVDIEINIKF